MSQVYEEAVARYLDAQAKAMETVKAAQTAIAELRDRGIATMDQHAHDMITAMRWQIAEKERAHASALEENARLNRALSAIVTDHVPTHMVEHMHPWLREIVQPIIDKGLADIAADLKGEPR